MFPKPPQLTDLQNSAVVCGTAGALYYFDTTLETKKHWIKQLRWGFARNK